MWIVWSDPKTNLSKILWLSSLPASLMKIWSKMKLLSSRQHFLMSMRPSRAVTHANCGKWAEIKLVCPCYLPLSLQVWQRSNQKWSHYHPDNIFPIICLWETKGQVTLMICPKIKLIQDFMVVLITCKSDEDSIWYLVDCKLENNMLCSTSWSNYILSYSLIECKL